MVDIYVNLFCIILFVRVYSHGPNSQFVQLVKGMVEFNKLQLIIG